MAFKIQDGRKSIFFEFPDPIAFRWYAGFGAAAWTGRSRGPWLHPGQAPALEEAEKGPKTTKNDFQIKYGLSSPPLDDVCSG